MNTEKLFPFIDDVIDGYDKRKKRDVWAGIIIHHTDVGAKKEISDSLWKKLHENIARYLGMKDRNYVSAHFQIGRFGEITQIVNPDHYEAFHAGKSSFWHPIYRKWMSDWNRYSIGVELLGDGNLHSYSAEQYESLSKLCSHLMTRYQTISPLCVVGHECVSPGRKVDPGRLFNWHKFYKMLYRELEQGREPAQG